MIDVLLADKGGKIGEAAVKSLRRHGLRVEVFDESGLENDEPGYIRNLKRKVAECSPKMILPVFKAEWLAKHRDEFDAIIPVADASMLALLDDKVRCSELCSKLGIEQPRMYSDDKIDNIENWPVVFKRASGLSGSSVYFPKNLKALRNLIKSSHKGHLIMDYIDGYDVSVDLIRWTITDGEVLQEAAAYKVLYPKKKGISLVRLGVNRKDIIYVALFIAEAVDFKGVCGMDFRVDRKTGKAFFLECNPRLSGGLKSSLKAGLDLPYLLWQLGCGENPPQLKLHRKRLSIG